MYSKKRTFVDEMIFIKVKVIGVIEHMPRNRTGPGKRKPSRIERRENKIRGPAAYHPGSFLR